MLAIKNDMEGAWRNFKSIFPRPLFIIIFRPEIVKFHPYSILTGDTTVEFVIYSVLITSFSQIFFTKKKLYARKSSLNLINTENATSIF